MSTATTWDEERKGSARNTTQWGAFWRRFRKQRGGIVGLAVLALMLVGIIVVPIISHFRQ